MTDRATKREMIKKKKQRRNKAILIGLAVLCCIGAIVWICIALFSEKPMPVVYYKAESNMLLVKTDKADEPFIVSQNYCGFGAELFENNESIVYIDADRNLCYSSIKTAESAINAKVLRDSVSALVVPNDELIYYLRNDLLYVNDLKTERQLASGVSTTDLKTTEDGRYLFYHTATDLFGLQVKKDASPVLIAEKADVYSLLYTLADDNPTLDSKNLYCVANDAFIKLDESLQPTVICKNVTVGFVFDNTPFAITQTQIGEEEYRYSLMQCKEKPVQITADLVHGHEITSGVYNNTKYLSFALLSDTSANGESYYSLNAKGELRYLYDGGDIQNLLLGSEGKYLFVHTTDEKLFEYKLNNKAEPDLKSKKEIASGVVNAYMVGDHISISFHDRFGIYHNHEYEDVYTNAQAYPKLRIRNKKAYICDQAGAAPFFICKNGKLEQVDTNVSDFKILSKNRVIYAKPNENGLTFDLYMIDGNKKPVLIDTGVTSWN